MVLKAGRIKQKEIFFLIAYTFFFISLFIGDLGVDLENIAKFLRYLSYLMSFLQLFVHKEDTKKLIMEIVVFAFMMLFYLFSRDIYLPMLVLLIIGARDTTEDKICCVSLYILIFGTVLTILSCFIGLIPDIMTAEAFSSELTRHSYGFYHSNVLPNNIVIVEILLAWKYRKKVSSILILSFMVLHIITYGLTHSRMSFFVGIVFSIVLLLLKVLRKTEKSLKKIRYIDYILGIFYSIISFILVGMLEFSNIVGKIDLIFSNRFWTALLKIRNFGIHILSFYTNQQFYEDGIIVDNGYLFITIRYGLIILILLLVINALNVKKNSNDIYKLMCIMCIYTIAFIDNLFLSYRFLPFLLIAILKNKNSNVGYVTNKMKD